MKQKLEMKKELLSILFGSFLLAGAFLASCSENEENVGDPSVNGERTLTFTVSSGFEDVDESARSVSEKPETMVRKLENGLVLRTVVEEDRTAGSRAAENIADGTGVLAIVVNEEQNKVHGIQFLKVQGGKLTVSVPDDRNVRIVFYSYNSPSTPATTLKAGDDISGNPVINTASNTQEAGLDAMMATTGTISPNQSGLGGIVFGHLFAQVCATVVTTSDASLNNEDVAVNGLEFSMPGSSGAAVRLDGSFTSMDNATLKGRAENATNTLPTLSTNYYRLIPNTAAGTTFQLSQVTLTVPIDIQEGVGTFNLKMMPGRRYTVKITIACKDNTEILPAANTNMTKLAANTPGTMSRQELTALVATKNCLYGGEAEQWAYTGVVTDTGNKWYWVIKKEYREPEDKNAIGYTGTSRSYLIGDIPNGWVTPGVKASGKYYRMPAVQFYQGGYYYIGYSFSAPVCQDKGSLLGDNNYTFVIGGPGALWIVEQGNFQYNGRITLALTRRGNVNAYSPVFGF